MSSNNDKAVIFSEDNLDHKRKEYASIQKELADFQRNNEEIIDSDNQLNSTFRLYESYLKNYDFDKKTYNNRLNNLQSLLANTPRYITGDANDLCDTNSIMRDIQAAKARGLTDSHPDIAYLNELIKSKKKSCQGASTGASRQMNSAYAQIQLQVQESQESLLQLEENYKKAKKEMPLLEAKLQRRPEIIEQMTNILKRKEAAESKLGLASNNNERLQETLNLSRKTGLVNYDIIQDVVYPVMADKPDRPLLLGGCFIASLIAASGFIFLKSQLEERITTVNQLKEAFDLPILGAISKIDMSHHQKNRKFQILLWCMGIVILLLLYVILIKYYTLPPTIRIPNLS